MEAHQKKLKEVWEECQRDLNGKSGKACKAAGKSDEVKEPESNYRQMGFLKQLQASGNILFVSLP
jgi:hypothetical protein